MKPLRRRLTYANVMSSIAVFLVVAGGSAFAANQLGKNTVGTKQLKNNAVTGAKIKNGAVTGAKLSLSTLGTVPSATNATHATSADTATKATTATHATSADTATNATNATNASHATSADSATNATNATNAANLAKPEAFHVVGQPGEPAFESGFVNFGGEYETAGFYLDRQCTVHLRGTISGPGGTAFTLPVGFRPAENTFSAIIASNEIGNAQIFTTGQVDLEAAGTANFGLTGLSFRVAGC
jgi:hypothetical protein